MPLRFPETASAVEKEKPDVFTLLALWPATKPSRS
jgi:hypothetical protein